MIGGGLFVLGVLVGAAAVWFVGRTPVATPVAEMSPSGSPAASVSPMPRESSVTFRVVQAPVCTVPTVEGRYMVVIDGTDAAVISGDCSSPGPRVLGAGDGWTVVNIQPVGLGGYIIYGEHHNGWYVNKAGAAVRLFSNGTDVGFSVDNRWVAYLGSEQGYHLYVMEGATGAVETSPVLPGPAAASQYGLPTFSPDGQRIAFVAWTGPDAERGEVYVFNRVAPVPFTKVGDVTTPPVELFWKPDGTVGWR